MTAKLEQLEVFELSLVEEPANQEARVSVFKNKDDTEMKVVDKGIETPDNETQVIVEDNSTEDPETELKEKVSPEMEAEFKALTELLKEAGFEVTEDAHVTEHVKSLLTDKEEIEKAKIEYIEVGGEQVEKSLVPAPVLKALEDAEAEAEATRIEKKLADLMPNIATEHAEQLLKAWDDLEGEAAEGFAEFLKTVDGQFAAATGEVGQADPEQLTPQEQLDVMIDAHVAEKGVSREKAYAEIAKTKDGAALINKTYK